MPDATRRLLVLAPALLPLLAATPALAATHEVVIENHRFTPSDLTVARGDRVVFVNRDSAPHSATQQPNGFDTGRLDRGQRAEVVFDRAGRHEYICAFHPSMRGAIRVG